MKKRMKASGLETDDDLLWNELLTAFNNHEELNPTYTFSSGEGVVNKRKADDNDDAPEISK